MDFCIGTVVMAILIILSSALLPPDLIPFALGTALVASIAAAVVDLQGINIDKGLCISVIVIIGMVAALFFRHSGSGSE